MSYDQNKDPFRIWIEMKHVLYQLAMGDCNIIIEDDCKKVITKLPSLHHRTDVPCFQTKIISDIIESFGIPDGTMKISLELVRTCYSKETFLSSYENIEKTLTQIAETVRS